MSAAEKVITLRELMAGNGQEGRPVYILHEGRVYDVSGSDWWASGEHMSLHHAGRDLTEAIKAAPHGTEVLERYPQVGVLEKLREFSLQELSEYNGKAGKPPYVDFQGVVYDVTASESWKDGVHMNTHQAGQDLTRQFPDAPHGSEMLGKYPIVGIIRGGQYG